MNVGQIAAWLAAFAAGLAGSAYIGKTIVRFLRRVGHFLDDWFGEVDRDGQPARPGVVERLRRIEVRQTRTEQRVARVEAELRPNGGDSMKDQINRIEQATGAERATYTDGQEP